MSTSQDLNRRLEFLKLGPDDVRLLERHSARVRKILPRSLERFYGQVRQFPEVRRFFEDEQRMAAAQEAQARHWSAIVSGRFDGAYVESVRRLGEMHARIGLEPRWYIGGYALILEDLVDGVLGDDRETKRRFSFGRGGRAERAERARVASLLVKAAMLDMDFAISLYMEASEAERAKLAAEQDERAREHAHVSGQVAEGLARVARGELTTRLSSPFPADFESVRSDFNAALEQLDAAIGAIASNAGGIKTGASEINHAADDLSRRTEQQAATLEETAAALDEITATVKKTAEGAMRASAVVEGAKTDAERSGEVVREAVAAMGAIEQSAQKISQIIGVIDEIAFQTNLLALNAGVEAARAGDAGRGFAVVASEVRALAQRSAEAAKEIKALISASSDQVSQGVSLVGKTGTALTGIVAKVGEITGVVGEISVSTQEQASALAQINTAVNQMDQATQQNAAMVEQSTAASHTLSSQADELARLVVRFRTGDAAASPSADRPRTPRPVPQRKPRTAPQLKRTSQLAVAPAADGEDWTEF